MNCKSIIQSSSSSRMTWKYDVFVSFRGEDTRYNFVDHLFDAFQRKGIVCFRDDTELRKGGSISTELMQAIEGSQVLIVVFSKNYATSTWCLQELAKIVDCIKESEVRKQSGDYGKAFARHEQTFKEDLDIVERWRKALVQVAGLSGWDLCNKFHHREIEKIVREVIRIMGYKFSGLSNDLVGMQSRVEQLEKLLVLDSNDDVRVVGVYGMSGIGKTTLVTELYHRLFHQYDACCFIDDVSKIYGDYGAIGAQRQLLCQTLNEENLEVWSHPMGTFMVKTRLRHVKALIVLDNVDKVEQLEKLGVNREGLCAGSRIIIISRDKHILREYGVDKVYEIQLLESVEARQLFCRRAFKCDDIMNCDDIVKEYKELMDSVLEYAKGLPLAIKVLGSFLCGRDISEWRSALDRLRHYPNKEIMDVLRISYDGLEETEKEIFLDIACFFSQYEEKHAFQKEYMVEYVKRVLDCCGFHPDIGIRVLIDKSLLIEDHFLIIMHDMLKELGMKIVREKAPNEPRKWSRLWHHKDYDVMDEKMEMDNIEAIQLKSPLESVELFAQTTTLRANALSKMSRLRLLIIHDVKFSGSLRYLSNQLRYLEWRNYPFTWFPSSCELTKLVELILPNSNIQQLWEGIKPLHNLKIMNLRHSKNLVKTPNFREIPNLEQLNLEGCTKLVWIDPSIGLLRKLVYLNLEDCSSLVSLPKSILRLSSLEVLNLSGCSRYYQKARHAEHLKKLDIGDPAVQCLSVCKRLLTLPFHFNSVRHRDIVSPLMPSFPYFPRLRDLNLSFCNLLKIPDAIVLLHCLERLDLSGNNFVTLPCGIKELPRLVSLQLEHCKQLTSLPEFPLGTVFPLPRELELLFYKLQVGLRIFNCRKLVEMDESWSSMAVSWMIQVLQVHKESFPPISIVVPGTQIPSWFNIQSVGNSMRIEPIPDVHDCNWIGLAFCVAFVTHGVPPNHLSYKTVQVALGWQNEDRGENSCYYIPLKIDLHPVEGVHLCLFNSTLEHLRWIFRSLAEFHDPKLEIRFCCPAGVHELPLEVKNFGMRYVMKDAELRGSPLPIQFYSGTSEGDFQDSCRMS